MSAIQTSEALNSAIKSLEEQIRPLAETLIDLRRQKKNLDASQFIIANGIKRADIEMSSGEGKPYFGTISPFINWLRAHSNKNWAEWNTTIYRSSDLLAGRMPDMPATISDLP